MSYNHLFKVVIIGDHNCGKSCLLLRFAENTFREDHVTTLGVDFKLKTIKVDRDKVRLELWDTAGMERYRTIYNSYYHSAHGVVVVYDIADRRSFNNVRDYWLPEVRAHAPQNAVVMLVGNKCEQSEATTSRRVEFAEAERVAADAGVSLFEVSAKTGVNVGDAFLELAAAMRDRLLASRMSAGQYNDSSDSDTTSPRQTHELAGGFHVDGVVKAPAEWTCCGGMTSQAQAKPTFV